MAQKYTEAFIYKGVEVRPAPQEVPQKHPNPPQTIVPQMCEPFNFNAIGLAVGEIIGGIVSGFKASTKGDKYKSLRKEMQGVYMNEKTYTRDCNAINRKHRVGSCASSEQPTIIVNGGTANITINNR